MALHPHPQRRRHRARTRSTRPTRSSRTTRRSAPARTRSTSTPRTSRPCSRDQPELRTARTRARHQNFIVQYFEQASALKLAIEQGDVDIAYRSLSPTDIEALRGESDKGVKVVDGDGAEIRYITFNVAKKPVDNVEVRQAIAQIIDREAIAEHGLQGHGHAAVLDGAQGARRAPRSPSRRAYGDPDPAKAKALLDEAGVQDAGRSSTAGTPRPTTGRSKPISGTRSSASSRPAACSRSSSTPTEWEQYKEEAFTKGTTTSTGSRSRRTSSSIQFFH